MNQKINTIFNEMKKPKLTFDVFPGSTNEDVTTLSHIGGKPFIPVYEKHPLCHTCKQPLMFVFQLNVPFEPTKCHLFVFYYCFKCNPRNGNKGFMVKKYINPKIKQANHHVFPSNVLYAPFDFELHWSLPDWETLTLLNRDVANYYYQADHEEFDVKYEEDKNDFLEEISSYTFDTFSFYGGYPNFLSKPVIPSCDCCNQKMDSWIQLDSYKEMNMEWDRLNPLHIFRCANKNDNYKILIQ